MNLQTLQTQVTGLQNQITALQKTFETHNHDGSRTVKLSQNNITPSIRAMGAIEMATDGRTYSIGVISNPTRVWFNGIAYFRNSNNQITIRAHVIGNAQLGKSYYFQPGTSSSVVTGGLPEEIIQTSSCLIIDTNTNTPVVEAEVGGFGTLVDVIHGGYIVARATITAFYVDHVEVFVTLQPGWTILGNFVVT